MTDRRIIALKCVESAGNRSTLPYKPLYRDTVKFIPKETENKQTKNMNHLTVALKLFQQNTDLSTKISKDFLTFKDC